MKIKGFFFSQYKTYLYYGFLTLFLVTMLAVRYGKRQDKSEADYVVASRVFQKWSQSLDIDNEELKNLEALMNKHLELKPLYEAQVGQQLLTKGFSEKSKHYIDQTLKRVAQPYYSSYSNTSVTISLGLFNQALEEALILEENVRTDENFSHLFAFNLIRIAMLYQEMGDREGELHAWKELKEGIQKEGFKDIFAHFTVGQSTLLDYIKWREENS